MIRLKFKIQPENVLTFSFATSLTTIIIDNSLGIFAV